MIRSFETYEEAMQFWSERVPRKQCDFMLVIEDTTNANADAYVPLLDWDIPEVGMKYSQVEGLPHIHPTLMEAGSIIIKFATVKDTAYRLYDNKDPDDARAGNTSRLFDLWSRQFTPEGVPIFIPKNKRPIVKIIRVPAVDSVTQEYFIQMEGCMFSFPKPSISQRSTEVCEYSMTVQCSDIVAKTTE